VDQRTHRYLSAMGVQVWARRGAGSAAPAGAGRMPAASAGADEAAGGAARLDWEQLAERVRSCTRCALHAGRTQTVFGVGDRQAEWLVVGEAPGAEEDRRGEPFVGRAGQLLTAMLESLGLRREQVYIANILKCRPPNNRDPQPAEVACCEPYLHRQIALLRPKLILAVGRIAAHNLLKIDTPLGRMRGHRYTYGPSGIPVAVTYHPAYLLRTPQDKRKAWQDLQFAQRLWQEAR
jgi:DNA polymerase